MTQFCEISPSFSSGISDLSLLSSSRSYSFTWLNVIIKIIIIIYFVKPFVSYRNMSVLVLQHTCSLQKPHDNWKMRKMRLKEIRHILWGHHRSGGRETKFLFRAEPSLFNRESSPSSLVLTTTPGGQSYISIWKTPTPKIKFVSHGSRLPTTSSFQQKLRFSETYRFKP